MTRIDDTCCCGAEFSVNDGSRRTTFLGYQHRDWLAAHAICRQAAYDAAVQDDDPTSAEFDEAFAAGEPVEVTGPPSTYATGSTTKILDPLGTTAAGSGSLEGGDGEK